MSALGAVRKKKGCVTHRDAAQTGVSRPCCVIRLGFFGSEWVKMCLCAVGADSLEISAEVKRSHLAVLWPRNPYSVQNQLLHYGSR